MVLKVCELTTVITLGAVNESLWFAFPVGLFTLLANATYSIGNDLRLQGQNIAIKTVIHRYPEVMEITLVQQIFNTWGKKTERALYLYDHWRLLFIIIVGTHSNYCIC